MLSNFDEKLIKRQRIDASVTKIFKEMLDCYKYILILSQTLMKKYLNNMLIKTQFLIRTNTFKNSKNLIGPKGRNKNKL